MQKLSCIDNFKWLSVTISDIAIITVTNVDSRYIILSISKYEAINLIKNSVLEYRGSFSLLKTVFFFTLLFNIYKMVDNICTHKSININIGTALKNRGMLKLVPYHLKTRKMCKHAVKKLPYLLRYVSD